jgi:uncharacterized surface protein with fasciclin (FAS1) repeats
MPMGTKRIVALTAALVMMLALPAGAKQPWSGPAGDATVVGTAVALSGMPNTFDDNAGDFDILVAAVLATGVDTSVLNGMDDYTVFAPTDQAFVDLAKALDKDGSVVDEASAFAEIAGLGLPTVQAVLAYHVTEGVRNSKSVTSAKSIVMLDGNRITARSGSIEAIGSTADLVDPEDLANVRVADGMIHVIDTVLLPFVP